MNSNGTSLRGHFICSYQDLVRVFGEPNCEGDEYKVSTEWVISDIEGNVWTIYDYKMTDLYDDNTMTVEEFRNLPEYEWHIGGHDTAEGTGPLIEFLEKYIRKLTF